MYRSYPAMTLAFLCLGMALVVVFCRLVNPYGLYVQLPWVSERNSTDAFNYQRLSKPYAIERISPEHMIVGSSRAARLDPQQFQTLLGGRAYNAALPMATLREMRRAVEHAHAIKPLESVIIGLDIYMFQSGKSKKMDQFEDARWRQPQRNLLFDLRHSYQRFEDYWRSLLSVDALVDSWRTLSSQESNGRVYQADGSWYVDIDEVNPTGLYAIMARHTYRGYSARRNRLHLEELEKLLDFTQANGIDAKLLISPMQGLLMHTTYLAHSWEYYIDWQRKLVEMVAERAPGVAIYGLEDNPKLVLETVNTPDPLSLDGIHFTRKAGREITACLIAPCEWSLQPTFLDRSSVDSYLQRVEALRRKYVEDNPQDVRKLRGWLKRDVSEDQ